MEQSEAQELASENSLEWDRVRFTLDEAMSSLGDQDRNALLLRFFRNQNLRAVGVALGISEDAAQKRVSRGLIKLREYLARHGVIASAGSLAVVISANAVQAAPVGLVAAISTAATIAGTTLAPTTTTSAIKIIAMTTLQKILVTAAVVATVGMGIYEARQASVLRTQVQSLQKQNASLAEGMQQLQRESEDANRKFATSRDEIERMNSNTSELLKLRGEVAGLRIDSKELAQLKANGSSDPLESAVKSILRRVNQLKQRLEQAPQAKIPELQFLSPLDWLELANTKLETEADYRKALGEIRRRAENYFAKELQAALGKYTRANAGQWPSDLSQIKPCFDSPVDEAMLQRWQIVPKSLFPNKDFASDWVITEKSPVDEEFDYRTTIDGPYSMGVGPYHYQPSELEILKNTLEPALKAYSAANGGKEPTEPSQLQSYIIDSNQETALQKLIQFVATNKPAR